MRACQLIHLQLTHRRRGQAPSHSFDLYSSLQAVVLPKAMDASNEANKAGTV